tara:strand:+ start:1045 stop:1713 length:669 start_codon:yes stop_codon:yes gene_type:complete
MNATLVDAGSMYETDSGQASRAERTEDQSIAPHIDGKSLVLYGSRSPGSSASRSFHSKRSLPVENTVSELCEGGQVLVYSEEEQISETQLPHSDESTSKRSKPSRSCGQDKDLVESTFSQGVTRLYRDAFAQQQEQIQKLETNIKESDAEIARLNEARKADLDNMRQEVKEAEARATEAERKIELQDKELQELKCKYETIKREHELLESRVLYVKNFFNCMQ